MNFWDTVEEEKPDIWGSFEEEKPQEQERQYSPLETAAMSAGQALVPFSVPIVGAGKAAYDYLTGKTDNLLEDYRTQRDTARQELERAQEQNPYSKWAGWLAGGSFNPAFRITSGLKGAALGGAITGLGESKSDLTKGEVGGAFVDTAAGATAAGLIHKGVEKIPGALYAAAQKSKAIKDYILRKTGRIGAFIPENVTQEYIDRRGKLNPISPSDAQTKIQNIYSGRKEAVEEAKEGLSRAKEEMAHNITHRERTYNEASGRLKDKLKSQNVRGLSDDIEKAILELKRQVNEHSQQSYEVLEKTKKGGLDIRPLVNKINEIFEKLHVRGELPPSGVETGLGKFLINYRNFLTKISPLKEGKRTINFSDAKKLIQNLDQDIEYGTAAGAYSSKDQQALKEIRHLLDDLLKTNHTGYRRVMEGKASDSYSSLKAKARLLEWFTEKYGTHEKRISRLDQFKPGGKVPELDLPMLTALSKLTKTDLIKPLRSHLDIQSPLFLHKELRKLPEYKQLESSERRAQYLNKPHPRLLQGQIPPKEPRLLQEAKEGFEHVKEFTPQTVESKIQQLGRATPETKIYLQNLFKRLDEVEGTDFTQRLHDYFLQSQFKKPSMHGSRNVQLYSKIGKYLFGFLGGTLIGAYKGGFSGAGTGAALGAMAGAIMDQYAGPIFQGVLNATIKTSDAVKALNPLLGKYAPILVKALERSPESFQTISSILSQDPEYQKMITDNLLQLNQSK